MDSNKTQKTSNPKFLGNAVFGLLLSILLTALPGCIPPKSTPQEPQSKIVSISEKASICESHLRQQMSNKSLSLLYVNAQSEKMIESANALIPSAQEKQFAVHLKKHVTQSLSIEFAHQSKEMQNEVSYKVSPADGEAKAAALYLDISIRSLSKNVYLKVIQRVNISESCQSSHNNTRFINIRPADDKSYSYSEETVFANAEKESFSDKFEVPADGQLLELSRPINALEDIAPIAYSFQREIGLIKIKRTSPFKGTKSGLGLTLNQEGVSTEISAADRKLSIVNFGVDRNLNIKTISQSGTDSWYVPEKLWQEQSLSSTPDLNSSVQFALPADYLEKNNTIKIMAAKPLDYDHISAYWKIEKDSSKAGVYYLQENAAGTIARTAGPEDLASNETIQTELPEIQSVATGILAEAGEDRHKQIQLILQYLNKNYTYDFNMLSNGNIRALTTQEALERGKGVCQHYAVIYTAIARALKIPTRIVMGYSLSHSKPALHAWNESEVLPGIWRPIEPQDPQSLSQIKTRFFLPTIRGHIFEDMNNKKNYIQMIETLSTQTLSIEPNSH